MSHRAPGSVWDKRGWRGVTIEERVAPTIVSAAGVCLLVHGLRRRSWRGVGPAVAGAALVGCAAAGLCNPRDARVRWKHLFRDRSVDRLTNALVDSFPASDPPSVTAAVGRVNLRADRRVPVVHTRSDAGTRSILGRAKMPRMRQWIARKVIEMARAELSAL